MNGSNSHQLKYNSARLALMRLFAESGYDIGDRLPSVRDLVKALPFGQITIRHALSDMQKSGLISSRIGSGSYLARRIRQNKFECYILLINFSRENETHQGVSSDSLYQYLTERGVGLRYISVSDFGLEVLNAISEGCLGIIASGWLTDSCIRRLKSLKLPLIVRGNNRLREAVPMVSLDLEQAAYRMTRIMQQDHLQKIALFRGRDEYYNSTLEENGYREAMLEAGLPVLIMHAESRFGYFTAIRDFMKEHSDVEGILMESQTFLDFMSWAWKCSYTGKPAVGFLTINPLFRQFWQSRNFMNLKFEDSTVAAGRMLLSHITDGTPLQSVQLQPIIPLVDDREEFFIY